MSRAARRVLLGCLVCQMGLGFSYVFTTFLKPIVTELGWTRTAFSAAGGPLLLSMALAAPLIGGLTDRFGPRRVLALSTLLLATALASFAAMQSLPHFYATSLLFGLALTGLGDIPVGAVAARWFAKGRGLVLGIVYVGSNIGGSLVPIAATAIAARASWRVALLVLAGSALALILPFALFAVREPRPDERPGEEAIRAEGARPVPSVREAPSLDLAAALRTRSFWILGVALFVFYFYYLGVINHLIAFLSDSGFSDPAAARRFGGAVAVGIVGKLAIGALADRIPIKTALLANFALVALASVLLLFVGEPGVLLAFLIVHGFAVAAENVLLPLIVVECFGIAHMAQIYGALMFALLPGGALGPIFAARMYDTLGSYQLAFTVFAALNAASLGLLCLLRRETPG
ncbi:MAG TPA: MFS transporter [Myxococcota bacterium]